MRQKWPYLKQFLYDERLLVGATFAASLLSNVLTVLIPISIGKYFNLVFHFSSRKSGVLDLLPSFLWDSMVGFSAFFIGVVALKIVVAYLEKYWISLLGERLAYRLRNELFAHQLRMNMQEYDEKGIGKYLLRYSGDLKGVQNYLSLGIIRFASDLVLMAISALVLLSIDLVLFAILISFMGTMLYLMSLVNDRLYKTSEKNRASKSRLISFVSTRLRSIMAIRINNQQEEELKRYHHHTRKILRTGVRNQFLYAFVQSAAPSLLYIMLGIILVYVYFQTQAGNIGFDSGTLLTAVLLLTTIMPVLRRILRVTVKWKLGNLSIQKMMDLFAKEKESDTGSEFQYEEGHISIEDLDFSYLEEAPVFQGLHLTCLPRQVTWVQGDIGTGKTTLVKLLLRVYSPRSGQIRIDGQDAAQLLPSSLRKHVSVVSSEIPIYGRTVSEAISGGGVPGTDKNAHRVLDELQAHIPSHLKLGPKDKMGDLGAKMSKGQLKLLAYARAFSSDRSLIVVDEPFSDLDHHTAEAIARMLRKRKHKSTLVILSRHQPTYFGDLANILFVDQVFRLEQRGEQALESTRVVPSELQTGQMLTLIKAGASDSKNRKIFSNLSVQFPGGKISVVVAPERRPRAFLRRILTGKSRVDEGKFYLGSKDIEEADDQFCREMVSHSGPTVNLTGNTALEAVYRGKDPVSREGAERFIRLLQEDLPPDQRLYPEDDIQDDELEDYHVVLLSAARAILSKKPVVVLESVFWNFERPTQLILARLIRQMRGNRTVVIIDRHNILEDEDLLFLLMPDLVVNLDELLLEGQNPQLPEADWLNDPETTRPG